MFKSLKQRIRYWRYKRLLLKIYLLHLKNPQCRPIDALYQANDDLQQIFNLKKEEEIKN